MDEDAWLSPTARSLWAGPLFLIPAQYRISLKTKGSERDIPLVGASLWAAKRIKSQNNQFAFPGYTSINKCAANSASAALNKWLKPRVPSGCVIHSFRHSLRDRLRAVECPPDIADAIGGWSPSGIGQSYGRGYTLISKVKYLRCLIQETRSIDG